MYEKNKHEVRHGSFDSVPAKMALTWPSFFTWGNYLPEDSQVCMVLDNIQSFPSGCSSTPFVGNKRYFMRNKIKRCHSTKSIKPKEGHMGTSIYTLNVNNNLLLTTGIKQEQSNGPKSSVYRLRYCLQVYIASELKTQRISSHLPLETHCLVDGEIAPHS